MAKIPPEDRAPGNPPDREPRRLVRGTITNPRGAPVPNLVVEAFAVDLNESQPLGAALTDRYGNYEIAYDPPPGFHGGGGPSGSLNLRIDVRAFVGDSLARSDVAFDAPGGAKIDLVVDASGDLTEYEMVAGAVRLARGPITGPPLEDEDIPFLLHRIERLEPTLDFAREITAARVGLLTDSDALAVGTAIPAVFFYGLARELELDRPVALDQILDRSEAELVRGLARAAEQRIIPVLPFDDVRELWTQVRVDRAAAVERRVAGRVIDGPGGPPVQNVRVRIRPADVDSPIGDSLTDRNGEFQFAVLADPGATESLILEVTDLADAVLHSAEVEVGERTEVIEVAIEIPEAPDESPTLLELGEKLDFGLPEGVADVLEANAIHTLSDLRTAGGFAAIGGLPVAPDHPTLSRIDAHAELFTLSGYDPEDVDAAIRHGFSSIASIAAAERSTFVTALAPARGHYQATRLLRRAEAAESVLRNMAAEVRVDRFADAADSGDPLAALQDELDDVAPESCGCEGCASVIGPFAYLVDLIDYALAYLKRDGGPVTLEDVHDTFFQPFGELPSACDEVDREVRQVRICIEVLRRYLRARDLPAPASAGASRLEADIRAYLETTYQTLLSLLGTSLPEVRAALRPGDDADRVALATRLGISEDDPVGAVLVDFERPSLADVEAELEYLFGLAETTREPFSTGAKLDDADDQLLRWSFQGVAWRKNTDADGHVYLSLSQPAPDRFLVRAFKDAERTLLVAEGESAAPEAEVQLTPPEPADGEAGSGLRGLVGLRFVQPDDRIRVSLVPVLLSRKLERQRDQWLARDDGRQTPLIDPDLIGLDHLKAPLDGNPAFPLFAERRAELSDRTDFLSSLAAGESDADRFAVLLEETGVDINGPELEAGERAYLQQIQDAVAAPDPSDVLELEFADMISILVQVEKRRQSATWLAEEDAAGIALTPDLFCLPERLAAQRRTLRAFRTDVQVLRAFERTLKARTDEREELLDGYADVLGTTEERTLPSLRDALIVASDAEGTDLPEKADFLGRRLLINTRMDACMQTNRVAQATETLQTLLWSARTGLLKESHPDLELRRDGFDDEWKWLGTYATWRAAKAVFLYPENALDPALRRPQSTAFAGLVETLRRNTRLTPLDACRAAEDYAAEVNDVAELRIEASCEARTRLTEDECPKGTGSGSALFTFLFARAVKTGNVFYSTYRPGVRTVRDQSIWEPVPQLQGVAEILGASVYEISDTSRFIYIFVKKIVDDRQNLVFARFDLEARAMAREEPLPLILPDGVTTFDAVINQRNNSRHPPELALLFNDRVFLNRMNREGNDLDPAVQAALGAFNFRASASGPPLDVVSMVSLDVFPERRYVLPQFFLLVGTDSSAVYYKAFLPANADDLFSTYRTTPVTGLSNGVWKASFFWPATPNIVYTLWEQNNQLKHNAIVFDDAQVRTFEFPDNPNESLGNIPSLLGVEGVAVHCSAQGAPGLNRQIAYQAGGARPGPHLGFLSRDPGRLITDVVLPELEATPAIAASLRGAGGQRRTSFLLNNGMGTLFGNDGIILDPGDPLPPPPPPPPLPPLPEPDNLPLTEVGRVRLTLLLREPVQIVQKLTEAELQVRKGKIRDAFEDNADGLDANVAYLEEAFYFVPMLIALHLQRRGHFVEALEWFRTVYDYSKPKGARKIYHGLVREETLPWSYEQQSSWLLEPLNPHAIAATRRNTYTRYTLLSLIQCFLRFADAEFVRDTSESVSFAHTLYVRALDLLKLPELSPRPGACDAISAELDRDVGNLFDTEPPDVRESWADLAGRLSAIDDAALLRQAVADVRSIAEGEGTALERLGRASRAVSRTLHAAEPPPNLAAAKERARAARRATERALLRQPQAFAALQEVSSAALTDVDYTYSNLTGHPRSALPELDLPWLGQPAPAVDLASPLADRNGAGPVAHFEVLNRVTRSAPLVVFQAGQKLARRFFASPESGFCVPPNPLLESLRSLATLSLEKIRTCRNIAGLERALAPFTAETRIQAPSSDGRQRVILPEALQTAPTVFRYRTLIERAKQLVALAQQLEATFLSILEKRDAEYYNLLKARQDENLSLAGVRLRQLGVAEARDNVRLTQLQADRALTQVRRYEELLAESGGTKEKLTLASMAITGGVMVGVGIAKKDPSTLIEGGATLVGFFTGSDREQRTEEIRKALALARQDVEISAQQVTLARDRLRIVGFELDIANLQRAQGGETLDFLVNQFTNAELYDWMSLVLEDVYANFLRQATAVAQLAANQLAFERQEPIPRFIQADYWEAAMGLEASLSAEGAAADRRGLTGSARLLQDIFQLDQYAFDTEQRKLQLTKTFSLARIAPFEFQRFRETGVLNFATLQEMFDRDFPGHFLRLIKRVRVSVIALIPPTEGIKATLSTSGISRVITRGDFFREQLIRRQPESVSFTTPINATGQFELQLLQENELLLPFEGSGVDTDWTFELPKAANQFDFRTIADVALAIDYTALDSRELRAEVVERLGNGFASDRAFSFRHELADQWFDLNNPDQTSTPMTVRFTTRRADFPPNLDELRIRHVALFFSLREGAAFEMEVERLLFEAEGEADAVGGSATSIDSVISTRLGTAANWEPMISRLPIGSWELGFADTGENRRRFREQEIENMLLVIAYSAVTPDRPVQV